MLNRPIRSADAAPRKAFYAKPYVQVLAAIALGIALGYFYPGIGESVK
ncbi:C4-dicarboxylate transporter DctA, partial [Mesorhizobium caraganae]|nr:C4-dicarboxylate transporter DctA [Mesorhizobium caraganae]